VWNFTVLGEAAGQLSDEIKNCHQRAAARPRNRIVHGYWSIDIDIVHTTATTQLSEFAVAPRTVLDSQGQQT
jgi:uncharacterized protein with HEPN domain